MRNIGIPLPPGEPDLVLRFNEPVHLPANGILPYKYMGIAKPMPHDMYIRAADIRLDNPRVIHHLQVMTADVPLSEFPRGPGGGILAPDDMTHVVGWAPGLSRVTVPPEDAAILVEKGRYLVAQVHYTTTGKPEVDKRTSASTSIQRRSSRARS